MAFITHKDTSRKTWGNEDGDGDISSAIKLGCLQRIADATEAMAKSYNDLLQSKLYWEKCAGERYEKILYLRRRINSLRGVITKLKRAKPVPKK